MHSAPNLQAPILHALAGKLLHIDFGDCFEASMHREKFPEKVPFRLTRMMVKAMEVSGIEGNFRWAASRVDLDPGCRVCTCVRAMHLPHRSCLRAGPPATR